MKRKYKIVNKVRFYSFLITSLAICFILIIFLVSKDKVHSLSLDTQYHQVEVVEGDTLWNIALNYLPKGVDVRKLIYDMNELNGDRSNYIYPGDIIKIPIY